MNFYSEKEPVLPGSFLRARAIGLMPMIDQVKVASSLLSVFHLHWDNEEVRVYSEKI